MNIIRKHELYFKDGSSDKEYCLQLVEADTPLSGMYLVNFQYGRRGSTLTPGSKTPAAVSLEAAQKIYTKLLNEKVGKGYIVMAGLDNKSYTSVIPEPKEIFFIPQLMNPIEESDIEKYLKDDRYGAQEKKDGRHQAFNKKAGTIQVTNKKGQAIGYPEALSKAIQTLNDLQVDSEAIGELYHAFDLLEANGKDLRKLGYGKRYDILEQMFNTGKFGPGVVLVPLARGYAAKKAMYDKLKAEKREGIVFKLLDATFSPGRPASGGSMLKCKFYGELSAKVAPGRDGKRSIGLELLDANGKWIPMGNCTIPPNKDIPSIGSVVEIRYLYCLLGGKLYQPTYKEVRDDIDESECLMTQVKFKPEED